MYGRAPQWSRWKWDMMTQSMNAVMGPSVMKEKSGKRRSSLYPICMPQSSIMFLPPIVRRIQLRPTSCPAPKGVIFMSGIVVLQNRLRDF